MLDCQMQANSSDDAIIYNDDDDDDIDRVKGYEGEEGDGEVKVRAKKFHKM